MFTYDGFDFSQSLIVHHIQRPILPAREIRSMSIFGRNGSFFFGKQDAALMITISVTIAGANRTDFREKVREIARLLNRAEPKPLIFHDERDKVIYGLLAEESELDELAASGRGDLIFYCPDPYYYAIEDEFFIYHSEGTHHFTREKGSIHSFPLIQVKGQLQNGLIRLTLNDTEMVYDGTLESGEQLRLDSQYVTAYTIKPNGERVSALNHLSSIEFPVLQPGANQLSLAFEGTGEVEELTIQARSRWV
ncbi:MULTISPECIES: distal tail protein Dit [Shouchella]|uniref:Siphovirus tail component n=3 Tax=Bacillaceae TaxID=186817 RepID=A0A060LYQ4_9BACI|nr:MULTISPECIES: distal tail protein Dit [Bacillaceae]RQW18976.1 phage tail protein [Bacillus sp. C1-1]AIC96381.1 Siphovirus tail component [Shouchella lehensis G1]KQL57408.1 hypothetical protein AN965_07830 [Alkalicoccobacillus plakortidis]MBG9785250.1 hypothetical protein [Shouchella lehensis]TES46696.1 phage tail protein [Shouchella lehensis]